MAFDLGTASNVIGKRGQVEYMLSLEDPNTKTKKIIALPFVNVFRQDLRPAVNIRHTLGRAPVIEHAGTKKLSFVIQGRSGRHFFLGANRHGNLNFDSGVDLFQELVGFLRRHDEIASSRFFKRSGQNLVQDLDVGGTLKNKKAYSAGHLVFMAPFEDVSYYVVPTAFTINRSSQTSRHSYEFSLVLEATAQYVSPVDDSFMGKALEFMDNITDGTDAIAGGIAIGTAWLNQKNAEFYQLLSFVEALERVGGELGRLEGSVGNFKDLWGNKTSKLLGALGSVLRNSYDIVNDLSFNKIQKADKDRNFFDFLGKMAEARTKISIAFGQGALGTYGSSDNEPTSQTADVITSETSTVASALVADFLDPVILPSENPNFSYSKVLEGETLTQFAGRLGFEPKIVAELNGMINFTHGIFSVPLTGGMILKIPADSPVFIPVGDQDVFGTDLKLDLATGDLMLEGSNPKDFMLISGPSNLKQGTTLRLLTREGENRVFPSLGLPVRSGDSSTAETVGTIAFETRAELLSDSRIESVTGLFVEDLGDTLNLNVEAVAQKETTIQFSVPLA